MKLPIVYYGNPILRKKCEPVKEITDDIIKLVQDMIETMDAENGIGLAAPQVGRPIRIFVLRNYIDAEDGTSTVSDPIVYINPRLSLPSENMIEDIEGCLSIPNLRCPVLRPDKITVEAMDIHGHHFIETVEGYNARVRMHENDHINGVLFVDRLDPSVKKKIEPELKAIKKMYNS